MPFPFLLYAFRNNQVSKNSRVGELAAFQPAETTVRLQIACFHLQTRRKWSVAQRRILKLRVSHRLICLSGFLLPTLKSVAGTPSPTFKPTHLTSFDSFLRDSSFGFWTCNFPSNEAKQRYFFPVRVEESCRFYTHTHTHSPPVCPSN